MIVIAILLLTFSFAVIYHPKFYPDRSADDGTHPGHLGSVLENAHPNGPGPARSVEPAWDLRPFHHTVRPEKFSIHRYIFLYSSRLKERKCVDPGQFRHIALDVNKPKV
jgi:hypothetical protein